MVHTGRHLCFKGWFLLIHQSFGGCRQLLTDADTFKIYPSENTYMFSMFLFFLRVSPCFQFLNHIKIEFFTISHHENRAFFHHFSPSFTIFRHFSPFVIEKSRCFPPFVPAERRLRRRCGAELRGSGPGDLAGCI